MNRIFKYPLGVVAFDTAEVEMPHGATIIMFNHQERVFTIWAEVDPTMPVTTRYFDILPTGGNVPPGAEHIASFQDIGYVWHLYERHAV